MVLQLNYNHLLLPYPRLVAHCRVPMPYNGDLYCAVHHRQKATQNQVVTHREVNPRPFALKADTLPLRYRGHSGAKLALNNENAEWCDEG